MASYVPTRRDVDVVDYNAGSSIIIMPYIRNLQTGRRNLHFCIACWLVLVVVVVVGGWLGWWLAECTK